MILYETLPGYAMLMSPNQDETAVHGCHYQDDIAVRMRKVMAIPRGWPVVCFLAVIVCLQCYAMLMRPNKAETAVHMAYTWAHYFFWKIES